MSAPDLILAVVGPTATGKSELAVRLAEDVEGEIVNADAMQLYRGMDIGTAKLPIEERRGIPHHQLDVLEVTQEATLAAYQRAARADLDAIKERGRTPILVGGSGLYVRAVLDLLEIPPTDPVVRARIEDDLAQRGVLALHHVLARSDPRAAAAIDPTNGRRIVRALEVIELTGRPFSATMPNRTFAHPTLMIGLQVDRATLDARIETRVKRMWGAGLLDEVTQLEARGLSSGRTARAAIGYAQALACLKGDLPASVARAQTVSATRRLVRRQESWFRADPRIAWVPGGSGLPDGAARLSATVARVRELVAERGQWAP